MNEKHFFRIDGFWKDRTEFYNYLVSSYDEQEPNDEDIFYYGLSESEIIDAIEKKENTVHEFIITDYRREK